MSSVDAVVTGAGGFIGGHLVGALLAEGKTVRGVDVKPLSEWHQLHANAELIQGDVSLLEDARTAVDGVRVVYNLAADMGGMGFIENNKAACMLSVLTSTHVLQAAREVGVERYFYSSSACVYAAEHQTSTDAIALREADAYPAMPEDGYGWEKLFSERMARHFLEDYGVQTRVARFHNVYGEHGTWTGGREKAPAAICRKIATAAITGEHKIDIWGDGEQTRTFMYIDDCVRGTRMITVGDDQSNGRHRLADRRHQRGAQSRPERPAGRTRAQQRQHGDRPTIRMGAVHHVAGRARAHLRLDLRRGEEQFELAIVDLHRQFAESGRDDHTSLISSVRSASGRCIPDRKGAPWCDHCRDSP
jgi:nucleoside-diphosphate-sugar epimerase